MRRGRRDAAQRHRQMRGQPGAAASMNCSTRGGVSANAAVGRWAHLCVRNPEAVIAELITAWTIARRPDTGQTRC